MWHPDNPAWRSPLHTIRDKITFASNAAAFRKPAFAVISALQAYNPAIQIDALFLTAVTMASALGLDAHELVTRAKRIMPDAAGPFGGGGHIDAIGDYAKGELRK